MPLGNEPPQGEPSGIDDSAAAAPTPRPRWLLVAALVAVVVALPVAMWALRRAEKPAPSGQPSSHARELLHVSAELFVNGRYDESIAVSKEVLATDPGSAEALNNMAVAYMKLGRWDDAMASAREALRLAPDVELTRNNLAWIERERAAAAGASPTGEDDPAGSFVALSAQHYRDGRWQDSIDAGKAALALDGQNAAAHNNISAACAQLGLWDEAASHAREALRLSPGFQLAAGNLAAAEAALRAAEAEAARGAAGDARGKKRGASK